MGVAFQLMERVLESFLRCEKVKIRAIEICSISLK